MAHNFGELPGLDDGTALPRKETSGMKRLWILALLLMPVFAGGCKLCYSWQLGRDRPAEPAAATVCPTVLHLVKHAHVIINCDRRMPSDLSLKRWPIFPRAAREPNNLSGTAYFFAPD